jgi:hypothetical protein
MVPTYVDWPARSCHITLPCDISPRFGASIDLGRRDYSSWAMARRPSVSQVSGRGSAMFPATGIEHAWAGAVAASGPSTDEGPTLG